MITLLRKHFFAYLSGVAIRVLILEHFDLYPQRIDRLVMRVYTTFVDPEVYDLFVDRAVDTFSSAIKALLADLYDDVTASIVMSGHAVVFDDLESAKHQIASLYALDWINRNSPVDPSIGDEEET